jgi:hypothetical protein
MSKFRNLFFLAMTFCLLIQTAYADVYLKQRITVLDSKDQEKSQEIQEIWVTPTKVRNNTGDQSSIFDAEKNLMITIDHKKKKYMEIPLDFSKSVSSEESNTTNLPSFMKNMMKMEVKVQPTSEEKQIGQWHCRKYLQTLKMSMGTTDSEIWASKDIHVNMDVYRKFSAALMASQPGLYKMLQDMMKESEKIEGIAVLQKSSGKVMGIQTKSTTELIEVKEVDAPADLFVIPAGYKKEKFKEE